MPYSANRFTSEEERKIYMRAYHKERRIKLKALLPLSGQVCSVDGCGRRKSSETLCNMHYQRLLKRGNTEKTPATLHRERFVAEDGTWECTTCKKSLPRTLEFFAPTAKKNIRFPHATHGQRDGMEWGCRECRRQVSRKCLYKKKYGITLEYMQEMFDKQGGKCDICGKHFEQHVGRTSGKSLLPNVDHCHATGAVRGLLCHGCNVMLGLSFDNPDILRSAITYLERTAATLH